MHVLLVRGAHVVDTKGRDLSMSLFTPDALDDDSSAGAAAGSQDEVAAGLVDLRYGAFRYAAVSWFRPGRSHRQRPPGGVDEDRG